MRRSLHLAVAAALLAAPPFAPVPAHAQDAPPAGGAAAADGVAADVEQVRRLVKAGAWKQAKLAIDRLFAAHEGNARIVTHVPEVEEMLRTCLFRIAAPKLEPVELLGRGAVKYQPQSNLAEFQVEKLGGAEDGWTRVGDIAVFDALFDGEMAVELDDETAQSMTVFLGFDSETKGAYAFLPSSRTWGWEVKVARMDPGREDPVFVDPGRGVPWVGESATRVRYAIAATRLELETWQPTREKPADRHTLVTFPEAKYRRGFVAVRTTRSAFKGLRITGRLDATFAKRQIAEADARRFAAWRASSWDREAALPAWVLDAERAGEAWADVLPASCPEPLRAAMRDFQRSAFDEASEAVAPAAVLHGPIAAWRDALAARAQRRHADAETAARRVLESEPEYGPAWTVVGASFLARGRVDEAREALERARTLAPGFAPTYDALALAAFREGDLDRGEAALAAAAANGTGTELTKALRQVFLRARRGPPWKKRFECVTPKFVVAGDAGFDVCQQVAKVLEEAADVYARQFRQWTRRTRARVHVFSGQESYVAYAAEVGADGRNSLGMYLPRMRELCVFLHENRAELWNTVRHEAFHQYLHDFLDEAPIWFNEGYAEFFGFSRRRSGKALVGQVEESQAALAKKLHARFSPLERLFVMPPAEFMANAEVHYVQSWAVVHLLRETQDPDLKGLLDRYFDALVAGRSMREAYDEVLFPVLPKLRTALVRHVEGLEAR